ncbi:NAD(P)-dependent oxidoreductase [Paenibacillus koleovorans]|uniref:NAD(P)-dependent oxidoreductase n=1 Tax=Paenibacillus koleovorans TaxID=121608 RepID=UPI000FD85D8D|nr:NAD(P)-dependent oxidoreductase [Paenibacillus koleovorans]
MTIKMLHLGLSRSRMPEEGPFVDELRRIGELTILKNGEDMTDEERSSLIREFDILLTMWGSAPVPVSIAEQPGRLKYICNITGEMGRWVPLELIESSIPVTNWGDAPADSIAEAAMTLLLTTLKEVRSQTKHIEAGGWGLPENRRGLLRGLPVGVYGYGVIGRRFVELLRPFGAAIAIYDPFVPSVPEDCWRADSLEALFDHASAVVLHAGLTPETRRSVTAELLARLPDGGVVINTARGELIDQAALFRELESGRLRAGLDVVAGNDELVEGDPAREWSNLTLTAHSLAKINWNLPRLLNYQVTCLDNIRRHLAGEPLQFVMDRRRYLLST